MHPSMPKAIDDLASLLTQKIKDKLDDWRKDQEHCAHQKVLRKATEVKERRQIHLLEPVSYTHLTLPTKA